MTRNAWTNACAASGYIVLVALLLFFGPSFAAPKDTVLAPIAMLSLLVLSAAFMAYTFFYQPLMLYVEGKMREAVELFTKTLTIFACITVVLLIAAFAAR